MFDEKIPSTFLQYATRILGDTKRGLTGRVIIDETAAYAAEYDVQLPHPMYPPESSSKRQALLENLMAFDGPQQYRIIKELCDHSSFSPVPNKDRQELKIRLVTRYPQFAGGAPASDINETLIEETRHWLDGQKTALESYNSALQKYEAGIFHRNLLDDLRLALELLLNELLGNNKSLENQLPALGNFIKDSGGSKELANMFQKLVEYYAKYQNSYAKHDSAVIEEEIEFIFEITSSFMKHLVRLSTEET
ncbi:hypothetical protein DEA8626_01449 [Defluviimonas aquaemixtae]|uniref:Uncharacterized protein n=1 Tax=Albidovulum aquaemixtae TaxID=1542388 RepID=A0A2R8B5I8_9RHOB|nr:hypothetical protein [Defluviimonas aquaemixtae]SPH17921.1 hypothetical protein DEA8626_01449 [Defluviimonas aquaemixtae]